MQEPQPENKKHTRTYKVPFFVCLFIAILQAGWIYLSSDLTRSVLLPNFQLTDSVEGLAVAQGSWLSSTNLANPIQTTQIECWKEFNHCWITDSSFSEEKYLSLNSDIEEIAKWNNDVIETVPSTTAGGCVEYSYRIDRRSKTVTATRRTVNKTGLCEGVDDAPIVMNLGNGLERLK